MRCTGLIRREPRGAHGGVRLLAVVALLAPSLVASPLTAQGGTPPAAAAPAASPELAAQREAMRRLGYMVGRWRGEGWIELRGRRFELRGGETVQARLDGLVLLVEGDFHGRPPGATADVPVHTTLGVISHDPRGARYAFTTWLATGTRGERELHVTPQGWRWELVTPQGRVRYVADFSEAGRWHEVGERSTDGASWTRFFEMTLLRQP